MRTPNATEAVAWIDAEELAKPFSALQLFAERARRVRPDFRFTQDNLAAVTEICKLVDGMPLGIELAAAWVEVLTPKEIAAEVLRSLDFLETDLQDVADRQRSIRAVFESSWKLLSEEEQNVFQALTVFRGSFSREAAQRVSGASLRMLLGLANKSWLQQVEEGRFQLHDVLRTYCYQHLQSNAEAWQTANDRHVNYFMEFVEALEQDLRGPKQIEAVNLMNKEFGTNIQAAWDWSIEQKRFGDLVNKILPGIFHFGLIRSQAATVTAMTKRARKAMPPSLDRESLLPWAILGSVECAFELSWGVLEDQPKERLSTLWETVENFGLADEMGYWFFVLMLAYREGIDFHQEFEEFQETLQKTRLKNDPWVLGYALLLASTLSAADEIQRENYLLEALNVFQQIGVVHEQASTLQSLGEVAWLKNSFEEAVHLKQAALELFEKAGDQFGQGWAWFDLAQIYLAQGHFDRALPPFQEQRRIYERIGNRRLVGVNLSWVSLAASRYGTLEYALETRQKSLKIAQEENNLNDYVWAVWEMGELYRLMGDLEQARTWYQKSLSDFERLQDNTGIGFYHRGLGDLALGRKQWEEACGQFRMALDAFAQAHRSSSTWGLIYAQAGLGRSLLGRGEFSEAREMLQNSIRRAQELKGWDLLYVPLLGMAELYAATGRLDRAMELATFIASQPIGWNETRSQARAVLEIVSRDLPHEIAQAARARGQSMTFEEAIKSSLEES
jgi:tetratricopeptide (TPR) repeat protein